MHPTLAVTLGDPRGIGPEVVQGALRDLPTLEADILLVGPEGVTGIEAARLEAVGRWSGRGDDAIAGRLSYLAIERAVELVKSGRASAIVTAPISKSALAAAGYPWPGHTEMLRHLTGVADTALCLAAEESPLGSPIRVVLVTGHMALRDVPAAYTVQRLVQSARLADEGLRLFWGLDAPRLGVCALNPHASDSGLFGNEEERVIAPAIAELRGMGIDVRGPDPADTVFVKAMRGAYDAVLAPYHDVGMTAIKTAAFGRAVNVTLGLPFPRTSPDHGTAFDIAGTGRADPGSMRIAMEAAARFARRALTASASAGRFLSK
jgi:4-hydroxythreonine-4-phosphate dehydrogenase